MTNKQLKEYRQSERGRIAMIFSNMRSRSKVRGNPPPEFTQQELSNWVYANGYKRIYDEWVASGFDKMKSPSVDRADDYEHYTINNLLRICTWQENFDRGCADRKSGINNKMSKAVIQKSLSGKIINTFYSAAQAHRETKTDKACICLCCKDLQHTANGYRWCYE